MYLRNNHNSKYFSHLPAFEVAAYDSVNIMKLKKERNLLKEFLEYER